MRLILVSHETLASAILQTAEMFVGQVENIGVLELRAGNSPEDFEDDLRALVEQRAPGEEALILCDLLSGTPFNVASKVSYQDDSIRVLYGMNLAMLLEVLDSRDELTISQLAEQAVANMPKSYGIGQF